MILPRRGYVYIFILFFVAIENRKSSGTGALLIIITR